VRKREDHLGASRSGDAKNAGRIPGGPGPPGGEGGGETGNEIPLIGELYLCF
jgi:hypothetical protein